MIDRLMNVGLVFSVIKKSVIEDHERLPNDGERLVLAMGDLYKSGLQEVEQAESRIAIRAD